jgi:hypothetical protein
MTTLRKYLDIISESPLMENPWEGKDPAKAAAWSALSPADQQWLGGADPTDSAILNRAPNKGKPVATAQPVAQPTPAPAAPLAASDTGEVPGVTTNPPAQAAQSAEAKNRDSMTFSQAFADARKDGEATFTWKGKKYTTEIAKPKEPPAQAAMPAPATSPATPPATSPAAAPATAPAAAPATAPATAPAGVSQTGAVPQELAQLVPSPRPGQEYWINGTRYQYRSSGPRGAGQWRANMKPGEWGANWNQWAARSGFTGDQSQVRQAYSQANTNKTNTAQTPAQPTSESTGYSEDQALGSIIQLAGLR